jgi:type II secretory pathway pseudopilin PulG
MQVVTNPKKNKGDTLIEVLFATAVFSLVAVSALSIMNQGTATAQRALEITLVRQEIDSQAETLRFLNASYVSAYQSGISDYSGTPASEWQSIKERTVDNASVFGATCSPPDKSFVLNTHSAKFISSKPTSAVTFSQVNYTNPSPDDYVFSSAEGIWIEAISSKKSIFPNETSIGYVDFHIRACWDSPGQSTPVTLGTIVRLYEPR